MNEMIYCHKLKKMAEKLEKSPFPGVLGSKIASSISKPAWAMWVNHQVMLINEYRLSMVDPKAKEFLYAEMEKFLFEDETTFPKEYIKKT